jgi:hypothetical protein
VREREREREGERGRERGPNQVCSHKSEKIFFHSRLAVLVANFLEPHWSKAVLIIFRTEATNENCQKLY